ncbi:MAG: glycosyl transferase [Solirubrobacterales bacterium]|nr:glycosyl transferase [Solirubrobacterales bacterium]
MRFLLITATDVSAASRANLASLLASLAGQSTPTDLILVMRGGGQVKLPARDALRAHVIELPLETSLSEARNAALAHAREHSLLDRAGVVGFPDDDCVYPAGLLGDVGRVIGGGVDVVCGPYGPTRPAVDERRFPRASRPLTPSFVTRVVSSNNVFFAAGAVRVIGDFDQRFGLGARLGSAEDSDYVLRALAAGFSGIYSPAHVFVEHPYKGHRPAQYYVGNVAVLAKHLRQHTHLALSLFHRLAVGALLVSRGELRARDYMRAIAVAASLAGRPPQNARSAAPRSSGAEA